MIVTLQQDAKALRSDYRGEHPNLWRAFAAMSVDLARIIRNTMIPPGTDRSMEQAPRKRKQR